MSERSETRRASAKWRPSGLLRPTFTPWLILLLSLSVSLWVARGEPLRVLLFGLTVSLLLFGLVGSIANTRSRTLTLANAMTEDLRESHEQFRGVTDTANDAIISADERGRITHFNRGAERMFGYSAEEAAGQPLTSLMPERLREAHQAGFRRFLSTGQSRVIGRTLELTAINRDGTEFPVELSIAASTTARGRFFTAILRDITTRKAVEEALRTTNEGLERRVEERATELEAAFQELRESRERLAAVVGSAMDAIITVDEEQRIVLFNAAAEQMFGYRGAELQGQLLERLIPECRAAHPDHIRVFGETGVTSRRMGALGAISGQRASGEEFPIEASISQVQAGGRRFYTVILRDISERHRTEQALQKSEMRFRALIENSADAIALYGPDGTILYGSPATTRILGYGLPEFVGRNAFDLIHPDDHAFVQTRLADAMQRPREGVEVHARVQHQDGSWRWLEGILTNLLDEPAVGAIINNYRDVTERMQAQAEVRRLNEQLEQRVLDRTAQLEATTRELEAFSYSVSHDLRAPLRHVHGFAKLLVERSQGLDDVTARYLTIISKAAARMGALIDDLLELSRTSRAELHAREVDLGRLVSDVRDECAQEAKGRSITWKLGELPHVSGDPALLRIVFANLLSNAVKFTAKRDQAIIEVGAGAGENGEVIVHVKDNGAGFDVRYASKLFGVFQRLHREDEFEGTGIGLATVRRIVHRHGGRVWAEGHVEGGAAFYVALKGAPEGTDDG